MLQKTSPKPLSVAGRFYRERDEWMRYVLTLPKGDLTTADRLVAVRIALAINPKERTHIISQARIAKEVGLSVQAVKNAVSKLRKMGLIECERVKLEGFAKHFNSYQIVPVFHLPD